MLRQSKTVTLPVTSNVRPDFSIIYRYFHDNKMTALPYSSPSWSQSPLHDWHLLEIKAGQVIDTHLLTAALITFGRAADVVTIPLAHESCSRLHARMAFDVTGRPWLRDLASTHGLTVNRQELPPEASSKLEPTDSTMKGSRGIMLFPGDMIQFGASSRIYVLEGPAKMERGAMEMKEKLGMIQQQQIPASNSLRRPREDPSIDDPETEVDPSVALAKLDPSQLSEGLRKQYESIVTKKAKLEHVEIEAERIQCKGELTEGQKRQLTINRERVTKLQEEIAEAEDDLYQKIYGKSKKRQEQQFAANDEDDVDDRTTRKQPTTVWSQDAESESSLTAKWISLQEQWIKSQHSFKKAQLLLSQVQQKGHSLSQDDDELFYLQNELDLARDNIAKADEKMEWIHSELNVVERLLLVVNGKLKFDRESGLIGTYIPDVSLPVEAMLSPFVVIPTPTKNSGDMMPPPFRSEQSLQAPINATTTCMPNPNEMLPPAKRVRHDGTPITLSTVQTEQQSLVKGPLRRTPIGTLAFLSPRRSSTIESVPSEVNGQTTMDGKKDMWVAPKGQDGSGKTKLNVKFAGRY